MPNIILILIFSFALLSCSNREKEKLPNIVIIFVDDMGYADVSTYGAEGFETPYIDQMANEGVKYTDFYVASSVCSPSRAALLTGCYPKRVGVTDVLFPEGPKWTKGKNKVGLDSNEITIADMLKEKGYATGIVGKWHLGHHKPYLPTNNGFDYYYGIPYSNDMRPEDNPEYPPLPMVENGEVIEYVAEDQSFLTTRYTEKAQEFIDVNMDHPFFLYLAHTMPHVPLYVSDKFEGHSEWGIYGDVIEEIDWSVGQVLKKLEESALSENTLVIFTSDNGPWADMGPKGGLAVPLRGSKQTSFEGGMRVPCIVKWKNKIPAGVVSDVPWASIDILPTIAKITNAKLPENKIDGVDASTILFNPDSNITIHKYIYFIPNNKLHAVRWKDWKYYFPHKTKEIIRDKSLEVIRKDRFVLGPALYNLDKDISETINLVDSFPEIAENLKMAGEKFAEEIEKNKRPIGKLQED